MSDTDKANKIKLVGLIIWKQKKILNQNSLFKWFFFPVDSVEAVNWIFKINVSSTESFENAFKFMRKYKLAQKI